MLIKARLRGHQFDLDTLAELFREGDPTVAADAEGHYMAFDAPDDLLDDGGRLHKAASALLVQVNGVGRVSGDDFRPVELVGRFSDAAGRHHAVVLADSAEVRARASIVAVAVNDQEPAAPPAPGPRYVQLARTHPDVAEALAILGKAGPAPDWVGLFKVFEIVNDSAEGCVNRGWVARDQVSAFTGSANRREISGDLSRHARLKGNPPKRIMTLGEARQVIGALVIAWMDSLR